MRTIDEISRFDREFSARLRKLWFAGDVHNGFDYVEESLRGAAELSDKPWWIVFLGDLDLQDKSFAEVVKRLKDIQPSIKVAYIYGNHDGDTHEKWELLKDCGDAVALHGVAVDLDGIRVAGIGGNFLGRVWMPPNPPVFANRDEAYSSRPKHHTPRPSLRSAIYFDEVKALQRNRTHILVTHEAPSCHYHGWEVFDETARVMGAYRLFHGHTHDDMSEQYAFSRERLGFDARSVPFRAIKNGLGEMVHHGSMYERAANGMPV